MANGFKTAAQKLKAMLDNISATSLALKFEYLEAMPTSFPAAMIVLDGSPGERILDTVTNELTARFRVEVVYAAEASQGASEKWLDLLDALGVEFRKESNQTMGGTAISFSIDEYSQFTDNQNFPQPIVGLSIRVSAKILLTIS